MDKAFFWGGPREDRQDLFSGISTASNTNRSAVKNRHFPLGEVTLSDPSHGYVVKY